MTNKLETMMRQVGRELRDLQVAWIFKVPEEMQQTPCDFFGYTRTGRAILLECKMVRSTSLKVGNSPGLSPHQWMELEEAHRAGAVSLIAWAAGGSVAVFPWHEAANAAEGRRSIRWADVPDWSKRVFTKDGLLSAVRVALPVTPTTLVFTTK